LTAVRPSGAAFRRFLGPQLLSGTYVHAGRSKSYDAFSELDRLVVPDAADRSRAAGSTFTALRHAGPHRFLRRLRRRPGAARSRDGTVRAGRPRQSPTCGGAPVAPV